MRYVGLPSSSGSKAALGSTSMGTDSSGAQPEAGTHSRWLLDPQVVLPSWLSSAKVSSLIERISDPKDLKKLLRTRNNVLVLYSKSGECPFLALRSTIGVGWDSREGVGWKWEAGDLRMKTT